MLKLILIFHASDSGKTLGGSSSINGGHWTRGLAAQYDAWSDLLEASEASVGWNWKNIWSYMKKVCIRFFSIRCPLTELITSQRDFQHLMRSKQQRELNQTFRIMEQLGQSKLLTLI